jgi:hypothetical protein
LFDVEDSSPWLNAGRDFTKLFKTGAAVDLQLGSPPAAGGEPSPGDLRVVIAPYEGSAVAVLMIQRARDENDQQAVNYRSPVAQVRFDRVLILDRAVVAARTGAGGYAIEAKLPLVDLGLRPESQGAMSGDVGIISSDALGLANTARTYWANPDTNLVNDLPQEARIEPTRWGSIRFE